MLLASEREFNPAEHIDLVLYAQQERNLDVLFEDTNVPSTQDTRYSITALLLLIDCAFLPTKDTLYCFMTTQKTLSQKMFETFHAHKPDYKEPVFDVILRVSYDNWVPILFLLNNKVERHDTPQQPSCNSVF